MKTSAKRRSNSKGMGGHQTPNQGETISWLTPPWVKEKLGKFDLDPCCPPNMPWKTATRMISLPADGLAEKWTGRVWLNPPFGTGVIEPWLEKMARHRLGLTLIHARTETAHWHDHIWPHAKGILFFKGRLFFHRPDGTRASFNAGSPSVLVAYTEKEALALSMCGIDGRFVEL
jgi:hypothetical protein